MTREEKSNELSSGGKYGAEPRRDDLLWKDLLARFFVPMLQSLLPDLARDIDGEREVVFLDKELRRLARFTRQPEVGNRTRTASSTSWRMFRFAPGRTLGFCSMRRYRAEAATRTFPYGCIVIGDCWRVGIEGP